jgi:ABC-2 type transport system permease protein
VTYCFLGQALIAVVAIGGAPLTLVERIRTGDIAIDLTRPIDLQAWWLSEDIGRALYMIAVRGLPPFFAGALAFHLRLPSSPARWLEVIVAVFLGIVVGFSLRYLAALTAFWLLDSRGVEALLMTSSYFLSGLVLPLNIFPGWFAPLAHALPFAAMLQVPADVFLGHRVSIGLTSSLAWAVALLIAGRAVTRAAVRRLVVQGG